MAKAIKPNLGKIATKISGNGAFCVDAQWE
jgi:hypothetical protein